MRYDGAVCQVCGKEFSESDDIVVCPDCGTPHHRQCWIENGHCSNSEKHNNEFFWQMPENLKESKPDSYVKPDTGSKPPIVCPVCKHENPASSEFCEFCGQKFTIFGFNVFDKQNELEQQEKEEKSNDNNAEIFNTPVQEKSEATYIDDVTTDDVSEYVRINHLTYIKKFSKLSNNGKKVTWNWASFIFLPYWFFYRKLIKPGIIFLMAMLCVNVIFSQPVTAIGDIYYSFVEISVEGEASQQQLDEAQQKLLNEIEKQSPFLIAYFCILLLIRIIAGLISDRLYKKKVISDIKTLRSKQLDDEAYHYSVFRLGGTSPLLVLAAYVAQYALNYLINFVMSLSA